MPLLPIFQPRKLNNYVVLFLVVTCTGVVNSQTNEEKLKVTGDNKTAAVSVEQKSVKKELKVNITDAAVVEITPRNEKAENHTDKLVIIDEKAVIESSGNALEQQTAQKAIENTNTPKTESSEPRTHKHHLNEEFILNNDDISESLKTGFYFFLILSSGAILFIIYKIYRLRLSRAERKYGVQGDRSNQELTPLPISMEDGHSDDEDQTLFDIQRQNIRIL